ncbi:uncharacterized protein BX664DRAFT_275738 [Halteromyces radiatus]|uniref:uncharacterized protein n=1 Tax=Halteromyces radiatus TaxID=101107 RepID=UPI0022212153|nr:uncharacterized protein BX664DRAFT_275738 [Halteromyces radiatus]KAI8097184.1 hypothetical protein BX664DRAFT_275738 [Halteromyces radiatus]
MVTDERKRKHKHEKKEHKDKDRKKHKSHAIVVDSGKRRTSVAQVNLPTGLSSFSEVVIKLYIHLAPMWSGKTMDGVNEILNAFLMKHVPEVDGIVLAHSDVELLGEKGKVLYDSPFCHFFIKAKLLVWKPKKGSKLVGRINLQSQDHIGLLIYGTFNASIPKSRISSEKYEWRTSEDDDNDNNDETSGDDEEQAEKRSQHGEWVLKDSGASIGGDDGSLEFSVVDIIEANDILTVTGSL